MKTMEQIFWEHVSPEPNSGCWLWDGATAIKGYAQMRIKRKTKTVARLVFVMFGKPLLPTEQALHRCDVPQCVNPDHLFAGSAWDNTHDAMRKGRLKPMPYSFGEKHPTAKLTDAIVIELRRVYQSGGNLSAAARRLGVGRVSAQQAATGKFWKHVGSAP